MIKNTSPNIDHIFIKEVKSKKDLNSFIQIPWEIYKNNPNWVPPLKLSVLDLLSPKHPFYKSSKTKCWIAYKDGKVSGRIMGIINQAYNEFHGEKIGFFGFFESILDQLIANSLFKKAEDYLKNEKMEKILGPMNPSSNYEGGLLVNGFDDPPQILMTYNPPYYEKLITDLNYTKARDLLAYQISPSITMPEAINKAATRAENSHKISYRKLNKKNWNQEIETMRDIYNSAWEKNWGFIPMSPEEFNHTAKDLKSVVDPNLIIFVEVAGEQAGFIVCLPDFNQVLKKIPNGKIFPTGIFKILNRKKYINRVRVITLGIKEKYRNLGLGPLLYRKIQEEVNNAGYIESEMSWVLEDNFQMNKPLLLMGAKPYKKYRIFEKNLD